MPDKNYPTATFGAGCFWGVEEAFRTTPGVIATQVGYTGGNFDNPSYEDVCSGQTGHAEAVQVKYDPMKVSYENLLHKFWMIHDPTAIHAHRGGELSNYRSVIFYHNEEQQSLAEQSKREIGQSSRFPQPLVTKIEPAGKFWPAEDYHQKYLAKRGLSNCEI